VADQQAKHLVLILAREFASNLATPMLIIDAEGRLVFFNEAAERVVGGSFAEVGEMPLEEFAVSMAPRTENAEPFPPERRPTRVALDLRRAAHEEMWITGHDGVDRYVAVSAFPLFAHADEFIGVVAIFWLE
jgi:PAS domain S-box-containing protein